MKVGQIAAIVIITLICGCTSNPGKNAPTEKTWRNLDMPEFEAVHSSVDGSDNEFLIFGNISISKPVSNVGPSLERFLGRWEGFDLGTPVRNDVKIVLAIRDISDSRGTAAIWSGTNLQYPSNVEEFEFSVRPGAEPAIEGALEFSPQFGMNGSKAVLYLRFDKATGDLVGGIKNPGNNKIERPVELGKGRTFFVYRDYAAYLAGKGITTRQYSEESLSSYGNGYLLYLPEGYDADPMKSWPAILFLCGVGDRGANPYLLAKASPFMMVRENKPFPFIVIAPLLNTSGPYRSFPSAYLDGVVKELRTKYRVDPGRLYLTGISMGGEAVYRFALLKPDLFAAAAPLSAAFAKYLRGYTSEVRETAGIPLSRLKGFPILAIQGMHDIVVPIEFAKESVDSLAKAGADICLNALENHDHDVWTDTYSDPAFYNWLLAHSRQ